MKRFALSLLSLTLSWVAFAPLAEANTENPKVAPFNLTYMAYQGRLDTEGIPGYGSFTSAVQSGSITAEDVIRAAIEADVLEPGSLDNDIFVRSLDRHLHGLVDRGQ